jgi:hypothetical protein
MIIACDFDQVIHDKLHPVAGRRMGPPFPDARAAMIRLKRQKHTVIIHTTMANTDGGKQAVADWLKYYKIPYDSIEPKIAADVYLDDKALHHTDWTTTMHSLTSHMISERKKIGTR